MSRVSKTVATSSNGGLSLDSTFTWNCQTKSWVWSPTKSTSAEAKDIRAVVVRSDLFKIGGKIKGRGSFGSKYGCRKKPQGLSVACWFSPESGPKKQLGKVNWWDVKDQEKFDKSTYNNIIVVKMISYKIVSGGKERDATKDDPQYVGLRIKGHSWKMVQAATEALKVSLIKEGKHEDAGQISTDELETCFIAYLSDSLVENTSSFGNTNTYPVPKFSILGEKQAALEQEAIAMYHMLDDELNEYLRSEVSEQDYAEDVDDEEPVKASTPPPPPTTMQSHASPVTDDLPF